MDQETLSAIIVDAIAAGGIDAATVVVREHGNEVAAVSAGSVGGAGADVDAVWWVASITKPVITVAALICAEEGTLSLDDPVSRHIPSWRAERQVRRLAPGTAFIPTPPFSPEDPNEWVFEPAHREVTVRDIVTGTSGLQTIMVANTAIRPVLLDDTLETFVDDLATAPLDFQPGERWHYSNATAFEVLARVVEVASGEDIRSFVRARIFDPLGMDATDFGLTERNAAAALPLHPMIAQHPMVHGFPSGSAGLFTTARDLAAFADMLVHGGAVGDHRILSEDSVRELTAHQIGDLRLGGVEAMRYAGFPLETNAGVGFGYGVLHVLDAAAAGVAVPEGSFGWDGIGTRRWWGIPSADTVIVILAEGAGADVVHRAVETAVIEGKK